jgi:hypothetical protein
MKLIHSSKLNQLALVSAALLVAPGLHQFHSPQFASRENFENIPPSDIENISNI